MITINNTFDKMLGKCPIIAILRGITPDEAEKVAELMASAGIRVIEVPLNSPDAFKSISKIKKLLGKDVCVGAGTVLNEGEVSQLADVGGQIAISPNTNTDVISTASKMGIQPIPGFVTPSEAFQAIEAGASHLKMFPSNAFGPQYIAALKQVLPKSVKISAVGGINEDNIAEFLSVGCAGVGLGSNLYKEGDSLKKIKSNLARLKKWVS